MDPYELKRRFGDKIAFWGGFGTQGLATTGTPASIRHGIARLRMEMGRGGGYILSPAKPLTADIPAENLLAIAESFIGKPLTEQILELSGARPRALPAATSAADHPRDCRGAMVSPTRQ